jgi:hypothetical protein
MYANTPRNIGGTRDHISTAGVMHILTSGKDVDVKNIL